MTGVGSGPPGPGAESGLAGVLGQVAGFGPFFAVAVEPGSPASRVGAGAAGAEAGGPALSRWYADHPALDDLLARTANALACKDIRVVASIAFQGFAARIWSPVLGGLVVAERLVGLEARATAYDGRKLSVRGPTAPAERAPSGPNRVRALHRVVVERHLAPMAERLRTSTGVSATVLWGDAASAAVGAYRVMLDARPDLTDAIAVAVPLPALLDSGRLRGTGTLVRNGRVPEFRRASCCLYYRVPGVGREGLCGDCVLRSDDPGAAGSGTDGPAGSTDGECAESADGECAESADGD